MEKWEKNEGREAARAGSGKSARCTSEYPWDRDDSRISIVWLEVVGERRKARRALVSLFFSRSSKIPLHRLTLQFRHTFKQTRARFSSAPVLFSFATTFRAHSPVSSQYYPNVFQVDVKNELEKVAVEEDFALSFPSNSHSVKLKRMIQT